MMRKVLLGIAVACVFSVMGAAGTAAAEEGWKPTDNVEWVIPANPGGGSEIFVRSILEIFKNRGISDANFVLNYLTDGRGEISRLRVVKAGREPHKILSFTNGELMVMNSIGNMTIDDMTVIGILASDKHILVANKDSGIRTVDDIFQAIKDGKTLSIGGVRGDDNMLRNMLVKSLGLPEDDTPFVSYGSNAEALTGLLGNHLELVVSKLQAVKGYLESGDIVPIVALSTERFAYPPFDTAPTLSELGYENVECALWRGIVASGEMPKEAADYYLRIFRELTETPDWDAYSEKNLSSQMNLFGDDALEYMRKYQEEFKLDF